MKARAAALAILGPLWVLTGLASPALAQYKAAYAASPVTRMAAGDTVTVPLKVSNTGTTEWKNTGRCAVVLGYHWFKGSTLVASETEAAPLPGPVGPGQTVELTATVNVPETPGSYVLAWDMRAQCEWFTKLGAAAGRQPIEVVPKQ
ncbi:MAG TPA: NBR1-Ig-like domain-containing protein [Methylomirabilota bacterium]